MSGTYHYYELPSDTGQSYWRDMKKGWASHSGGYDGSIFDLGPFETVDAYQWHGWDKDPLRNWKGEIIMKRPPMWEVAAVDSKKDSRVVLARTTGNRDDVFTLTTRANKLLQYTQDLLAPYRDKLEHMQQNRFVALSQMPEGTTDEMAHIFDEIGATFVEDRTLDFKGWMDKP